MGRTVKSFNPKNQFVLLIIGIVFSKSVATPEKNFRAINAETVEEFVQKAERALQETKKILTYLDWTYQTNITQKNEQNYLSYKVDN